MAITSYPFDGQETTEDDYGRLFKEFSTSGVAASQGSNALQVSSNGTTMNVQVAAGLAVVRGCAFRSTATENVLLAAPPSGTRVYMIVLELNQTTNQITLSAIAGTGSGEPVLSDNADVHDSGTFHVPLARVTVPAGATAVAAGNVQDRRRFIGRQVGAWSGPDTRPTYPRKGEVGYSAAIDSFEFYDGAAWRRVGALAGEIKMFAGTTVPTGWLLCDGGFYPVATYPDLHAAIGYIYGSGGGGTEFRVPTLTNRVPRGAPNAAGVGPVGGADTVTLAVTHLPSHRHNISHDHDAFSTGLGGEHTHNGKATSDATATGGTARFRDATTSGTVTPVTNEGGGGHAHTINIPPITAESGDMGGGNAFSIMPSHQLINFIIKT